MGFRVKAWAMFDIPSADASSETEAIEKAADELRELKPDDFEYDVEEVKEPEGGEQ